MTRRICVLGSGAWGNALAHVARTAGHGVTVWSRRSPDSAAVAQADTLIVAVPAQAVRETLTAVAPHVKSSSAIVIGAKGIEQGTGLLMNEVVLDIVPHTDVFVLSGPSFAADVLAGLPTAVVVAGCTLAQAADLASALALPQFRIYASNDVVGVEIGGALKNVLAIACGIADGQGLGDSARAALTTRGFAELVRFGRKRGARPETVMGLSGLGDLLLTCSSRQSRNYAFGHAIGGGESVNEALAASRGVVEGAFTVKVAHELALEHGVEMPIVAGVLAIVDGGASPRSEIARLLARPLKSEVM
jgi:glycerol-3-phosphate dehydrogenase (NAD(P)+)